MNATLNFTLPEEANDLQLALDGYKYRAALESLDQKLRNLNKYEGKDSLDIPEVRSMIQLELDERNLKIYE